MLVVCTNCRVFSYTFTETPLNLPHATVDVELGREEAAKYCYCLGDTELILAKKKRKIHKFVIQSSRTYPISVKVVQMACCEYLMCLLTCIKQCSTHTVINNVRRNLPENLNLGLLLCLVVYHDNSFIANCSS